MLAIFYDADYCLDDYRYQVVTNLAAVTPDLNQQVTVVQMPSTYTVLHEVMTVLTA